MLGRLIQISFHYPIFALFWLLLGLGDAACDSQSKADTGRTLCEGDFCSCWSDDDCMLTDVNGTTCHIDCCVRIPIAKKFDDANQKLFTDDCNTRCMGTCPRATFHAECDLGRCAAIEDAAQP
jgi:hypothetical protein